MRQGGAPPRADRARLTSLHTRMAASPDLRIVDYVARHVRRLLSLRGLARADRGEDDEAFAKERNARARRRSGRGAACDGRGTDGRNVDAKHVERSNRTAKRRRTCTCSVQFSAIKRRATRADHRVEVRPFAVPHVQKRVRLAWCASSTLCIVACCVPRLLGFVLDLVAFFTTAQEQRRRQEVRSEPTREQDAA